MNFFGKMQKKKKKKGKSQILFFSFSFNSLVIKLFTYYMGKDQTFGTKNILIIIYGGKMYFSQKCVAYFEPQPQQIYSLHPQN